MRISNFSQSSFRVWKMNGSGMRSVPHGLAHGSKPPMSRPPTSSFT
jgi:hypothetical protein